MKTSRNLLVAIVAICIFLSGCTPSPQDSPAPKQPELPQEQTNPDEDAADSISALGLISYDSGEARRLSSQHEGLIKDYMHMYYRSLANLEVRNPIEFFAEKGKTQALTRQSAWKVIVDVRSKQKLDLSLTGYSFNLIFNSIKTEENGEMVAIAKENAVQNFTAFPGIDSKSYNVYHRFSFEETSQGWKILSHVQVDSANMLALGRAMFRGGRNVVTNTPNTVDGNVNSGGSIADILVQQHENVITAHETEMEDRENQREAYNTATVPDFDWTHNYDRDAAVEYAMEWVAGRNTSDWASYDRNGGNCVNYTSQCLLAGGIPMDYVGASQWKWYGLAPNATQTAAGRSGSWSSVSEFYDYVNSNIGFGMVAESDANFWSGEVGDLIQLGYEGDWRHVVIITHVIKDEAGNTVDYLINSNTADQYQYPISAYIYPQQRLIKIYGWKEI